MHFVLFSGTRGLSLVEVFIHVKYLIENVCPPYLTEIFGPFKFVNYRNSNLKESTTKVKIYGPADKIFVLIA